MSYIHHEREHIFKRVRYIAVGLIIQFFLNTRKQRLEIDAEEENI